MSQPTRRVRHSRLCGVAAVFAALAACSPHRHIDRVADVHVGQDWRTARESGLFRREVVVFCSPPGPRRPPDRRVDCFAKDDLGVAFKRGAHKYLVEVRENRVFRITEEGRLTHQEIYH